MRIWTLQAATTVASEGRVRHLSGRVESTAVGSARSPSSASGAGGRCPIDPVMVGGQRHIQDITDRCLAIDDLGAPGHPADGSESTRSEHPKWHEVPLPGMQDCSRWNRLEPPEVRGTERPASSRAHHAIFDSSASGRRPSMKSTGVTWGFVWIRGPGSPSAAEPAVQRHVFRKRSRPRAARQDRSGRPARPAVPGTGHDRLDDPGRHAAHDGLVGYVLGHH